MRCSFRSTPFWLLCSVLNRVVTRAEQLIAEGSGEDEEADEQLRREAVDSYLELLDTPAVPDQVITFSPIPSRAPIIF